MFPFFIAIIAIVAVVSWIMAEFRTSRIAVRLAFGAVALGAVSGTFWVAGTLSSQFSKTLQTNNVAKNLTSGIVEITSKPYDIEEFHMRIQELDGAIMPTYEHHLSAENAIQQFLSEYGIQYRVEMPIRVDNQYKPVSEDSGDISSKANGDATPLRVGTDQRSYGGEE